MPYDAVVDSAALDATFTGIANVIRSKDGSTELLTHEQMAAQIETMIGFASGNLADPDGIIPNKYLNGGAETAYGGWSITAWIPVDPNKSYSVTPPSVFAKNANYSGLYDENKAFIRVVSSETDFATSDKIVTFKPPANARFVRFSGETRSIEKVKVYEIIV